MGLFIDWPRGPTPARDPLGECRDTMDGRRLAATRRPPRQIQAKRAVQSHSEGIAENREKTAKDDHPEPKNQGGRRHRYAALLQEGQEP